MKAALPIIMAVLGNLLYHSSQKLTSQQVNPFLSVGISFAVAAALAFGAFFLTRAGTLAAETAHLSWTAIGLGVSVIVIEASFLIAYRLGWQVGVTSLVVVVGQTALLLPLGYFVFGERFTATGVAGVVIGLVGLAMVTFQSAPR